MKERMITATAGSQRSTRLKLVRPMPGLVGLLLLSLGLGFLGTTGVASPPDADALRRAFEGPLRVKMRSGGRTLTGHPTSVSETELSFFARAGAGEVVYTVAKDDIAGIAFPGGSVRALALELLGGGRHAEAIPLLEALLAQRERYFGLLGEPEALFFVRLVDAYLRNGQAAEAVGMARRLLPRIGRPDVRAELEEAVLLGHFNLGFYERTKPLVKAWLAAAERQGPDALGWWIAGQIALEEERPEEALWITLQPVVFSGQLPMEHLEHCYAVAIAACHALERAEKAEQLFAEMEERELPWPDLPKLAAVRDLHRKPEPAEEDDPDAEDKTGDEKAKKSAPPGDGDEAEAAEPPPPPPPPEILPEDSPLRKIRRTGLP